MHNKIVAWVVCSLLSPAVCGMEPLDDADLQQVDGQAGAVISLDLRLNHFGTGANANRFDTSYCNSTNLQYCRLAVSFNNRELAGGLKQWLVFKGIQGTVLLQDISFEGRDLLVNNGTQIKAAIKLSFDFTKPIVIRNFGFDAIAVENDTANTDAGRGYLNTDRYAIGQPRVGLFDATHSTLAGTGRETGFAGLNVHGNLATSGSVSIFSCAPPRC